MQVPWLYGPQDPWIPWIYSALRRLQCGWEIRDSRLSGNERTEQTFLHIELEPPVLFWNIFVLLLLYLWNSEPNLVAARTGIKASGSLETSWMPICGPIEDFNRRAQDIYARRECGRHWPTRLLKPPRKINLCIIQQPIPTPSLQHQTNVLTGDSKAESTRPCQFFPAENVALWWEFHLYPDFRTLNISCLLSNSKRIPIYSLLWQKFHKKVWGAGGSTRGDVRHLKIWAAYSIMVVEFFWAWVKSRDCVQAKGEKSNWMRSCRV